MANRKKQVYKPKPMTEGKRNLIQGLLQEYDIHGSLTLCFSIDFHNPLQHSPLRLIFLSNFKILLVIVCHCVV